MGTPRNDSLTGGAVNNLLEGAGGNDTLLGLGGDDRLYGGIGDDALYGSTGRDTLLGGAGADLLYAGSGSDLLDGGLGNDLFGIDGRHLGTVTVADADGNDTLVAFDYPALDFADFINYGDRLEWVSYQGHITVIPLRNGVSAIEWLQTVTYAANGVAQPADQRLRISTDLVHITANRVALVGTLANDIVHIPDIAVVAGDTEYGHLFTNAGNDVVTTSNVYSFQVYAGSGNDTLTGGIIRDGLFGGADQDSIFGGAGRDVLTGDRGNDRIFGGAGRDSVYGDEGNDTLMTGAADDKLHGGEGQDSGRGGLGNDSLWGEAGLDTLWGEAGDDQVVGDEGDDRLFGGIGKDRMWGYLGNDRMFGEAGVDVMQGGLGEDAGYGGGAGDTLLGQDGNDSLYGGVGVDLVVGQRGNDVLFGGAGNDTVYGDEGNDTLNGDAGADRLYGYTGADVLNAGSGYDSVYAGNGNDTIFNSAGLDLIFGGSGSDSFVILPTPRTVDDEARILDFEFGIDTLVLDGRLMVDFGGYRQKLSNLTVEQVALELTQRYGNAYEIQLDHFRVTLAKDASTGISQAEWIASISIICPPPLPAHVFRAIPPRRRAPIAQLVEHLICNQGVCGSSPYGGTSSYLGGQHATRHHHGCRQRHWPRHGAGVSGCGVDGGVGRATRRCAAGNAGRNQCGGCADPAL